jgi:FkbM family methyltransferase
VSVRQAKRVLWHFRATSQRVVRAVRLFANFPVYFGALWRRGPGVRVLKTRDGLKIAVRENLWDARIVREIYIDRPYLRYFEPPPNPVVIDVGAYIGDFSLYCAHYLNARVVAYEPTAENYDMVVRNIALNGLGGQVEVVNRGVAADRQITVNVQKLGQEVHASAYWYSDAEPRTIECTSLAEIIDAHGLRRIDLLKVDCEGGEYEILPATPDEVYDRIDQIVFEFHKVDGYEAKLARVVEKLERVGYTLTRAGMLMYATRGGMVRRKVA